MNEGPDKTLRDAVVAFLASLNTSDVAWEYLFPRMATATRNKWRTHFRALWTKSVPATSVRLGYPRGEEQPWPVVGFVLAANPPQQDVAGRAVGYTAAAPKAEVFEAVSEQTVVAYVVTKGNADECRLLAIMVKAGCMVARNRILGTDGYAGYSYAGMQDLRPQDVYLPEDCFVRLVSFSVTELDQVATETATHFLSLPVRIGIVGEDVGDGQTGGVVPVEELS